MKMGIGILLASTCILDAGRTGEFYKKTPGFPENDGLFLSTSNFSFL